MSNNYEMMYILRSDLGEEQVDATIAKYETLLREQGAQDVQIQHRGRRRLAYEIDRQREGIYIQMNYKAPGAHVAVIERTMRLSEEVIRYLTMTQDVKAEAAAAPEPVEVEA